MNDEAGCGPTGPVFLTSGTCQVGEGGTLVDGSEVSIVVVEGFRRAPEGNDCCAGELDSDDGAGRQRGKVEAVSVVRDSVFSGNADLCGEGSRTKLPLRSSTVFPSSLSAASA